MDRLVQLQRGRPRLKPPTIAEEEESDEDVADFYQYVPRRKGDFPPAAYEPSDVAPQVTRYEIVDREFEDDIPVYLVREWKSPKPKREALPITERGEDLVAFKTREDKVEDGRTDLQKLALRTRRSSSRQTPVSASSNSVQDRDSLNYDPDDPSLLHVDLFDIYNYVSPKELERFETYRFENPKQEDYPVMIPLSVTSSVVEREERVVHRDEVKSIKPGPKPKGKPGRPPKKNSRMGPMVVIESPRAISRSTSSGDILASSVIEDSEDVDEEIDNGVDFIQPSIEVNSGDEELDILDMSTSLRGTGGLLGSTIRPKTTMPTPRRSTRSASRLLSPDRQIRLESRQSKHEPKRRGLPPKVLNDTSRLQPTSWRGSKTPHSNGNGTIASSTSTSRSGSRSNTQTTIDSYLKAMSKVKEAKEPSFLSKSQNRTSPREQTPQLSKSRHEPPAKLNGQSVKAKGKQPISRSQSVQLFDESVLPADEPVEDEEGEYEIDRILLHDDSTSERFYLVAWKGYDLESATWLTEHELEDAQDALQEYLQTLVDKMVD